MTYHIISNTLIVNISNYTQRANFKNIYEFLF